MFTTLVLTVALAQPPQPDNFEATVKSYGPAAANFINISPENELTFEGYDVTALRFAIKRKAIEMELMDDRERLNLFTQNKTLGESLKEMQKRREIAKDFPKVSEANWLPKREDVVSIVEFNQKYKKHLKDRVVWEPDRAAILGKAIEETDKCFCDWVAIREAATTYPYIMARREAIHNLRKVLTEHADKDGNYWETRRLPPFVPYWRFNESR